MINQRLPSGSLFVSLTYGAFGTSLVALFMCFRFMQLTAVRAALPVLLFVLIQLLHKRRTELE